MSANPAVLELPAIRRMPLRLRLAAEFAALFFAAPLLHVTGIWPWHPIPLLFVITLPAAVWILRDHKWRAQLCSCTDAINQRRLVLFAICSVALFAAISWAAPDAPFSFPRRHPVLFILFLLAYPIFSVLPQELIFRAFLFRRYHVLFANPAAMVFASAIAFAFAHIVFHNPVAPLLSFVGGLLFSWCYWKTHSLLAVIVEHSLYGIAMFALGLHGYFTHGFGP